jgi:hypothetical protein
MQDLTTVVSDDRAAFGEIAQALHDIVTVDCEADLAKLRKQCEDRVTAIDAALKDA